MELGREANTFRTGCFGVLEEKWTDLVQGALEFGGEVNRLSTGCFEVRKRRVLLS